MSGVYSPLTRELRRTALQAHGRLPSALGAPGFPVAGLLPQLLHPARLVAAATTAGAAATQNAPTKASAAAAAAAAAAGNLQDSQKRWILAHRFRAVWGTKTSGGIGSRQLHTAYLPQQPEAWLQQQHKPLEEHQQLQEQQQQHQQWHLHQQQAKRPGFFSVCIVGAGPSGLYCAKMLLRLVESYNQKQMQQQQQHQQQQHQKQQQQQQLCQSRLQLEIVVIDALPTPLGLVRYGVAADKPEIKVVGRELEAVRD